MFLKKGPSAESEWRKLTGANENPPTPYIPLTICGTAHVTFLALKLLLRIDNREVLDTAQPIFGLYILNDELV